MSRLHLSRHRCHVSRSNLFMISNRKAPERVPSPKVSSTRRHYWRGVLSFGARRGMVVTAEQFRRLALSFPEAYESSHMEHPDFRVRGGKIFATLSHGEKSGMV